VARTSRGGHGRRFLAAYAVVAALALAAVAGALVLTFGMPGGERNTCAERIPTGQSVASAWKTTELFVADVMLNRRPSCGHDLSTRRLRGHHHRAEWGTSRSPVHAFSTHYPAVPMSRASRDPRAPQAVYILSRTVDAFVVFDRAGRATIPMMVGVSAPDAGRAAYNVLLVLEDGSWRVDRVRRIVVHESG
jgi:hypothetical protein